MFWPALVQLSNDNCRGRSKHLAESTIKRRKAEREKIIKQEREKEEQEKMRKKLEDLKKAEEL